jgi:hypothetical protein
LSSTPINQSPDETEPPELADAGRSPGPERFEAARLRLQNALDALRAAISRQTELTQEQADRMAEHDALQEDRSRLAVELDATGRKTRALEAANGEAARRIERAAAAVRAILASDSSQERLAHARATGKDSSQERLTDARATAPHSSGDA